MSAPNNDCGYLTALESSCDCAAASRDSRMISSSQPVDKGWQRVLTVETMNPYLRAVQLNKQPSTVLHRKVYELERDLRERKVTSLDKVFYLGVGDSQALGQLPIAFLRQVIALCTYSELLETKLFPEDAKQRARRILNECRGHTIGSYTDAIGLELIRRDVASYITERDGGIPADYGDIVLCNGATFGIKAILSTLMTCRDEPYQAGVMIPVPQYHFYGLALKEFNGFAIPYYLDEDNDWALNIDELQRALDQARKRCIPRAIVVINPGNPTGQVLSRQNIEDVIKFAQNEGLFILADEVYQHNVYEEGFAFHSFKKVMKELGGEFAEMQLASFMSISKGYMGECGLRGGYFELVNVEPMFMNYIRHLSREGPSMCGQIAVDVVVNPPKPSEPSFEEFNKERTSVLEDLAVKACLASELLNSVEGIRCNQVRGSMYAYPRIFLPDGAINEAKSKGQSPDHFFCTKLLENTGIFARPGSEFGQKEGTYHVRLAILNPVDELKAVLKRLNEFHETFVAQY